MDQLYQALNMFVHTEECSELHLRKHKGKLIQALEACQPPYWQDAVHQLHNYRHGISRAIVDTTQSEIKHAKNLIIAEINQEFAPHLKFEWLEFEDAAYMTGLYKKLPSLSRPIRLLETSAHLKVAWQNGIPLVNSVVIFPEGWRYPTTKTRDQLDEWEVLFFVDRFAIRTETYSWKILDRCLSESTFGRLRQFRRGNREKLAERLCSDWLGPHERNHHSGSLPYEITPAGDDLRKYKNCTSSSAFEEMRADVNAILELGSAESDEDASCVAEFIALERIFRYPVQFCIERQTFLQEKPRKTRDYDSIGSQLLCRFLIRKGYLEVQSDGKLALKEGYRVGLQDYAVEAERIQQEAIAVANRTSGNNEAKMAAGKKHIARYVKENAGYDPSMKDYPVDDYYRWMVSKVMDDCG